MLSKQKQNDSNNPKKRKETKTEREYVKLRN